MNHTHFLALFLSVTGWGVSLIIFVQEGISATKNSTCILSTNKNHSKVLSIPWSVLGMAYYAATSVAFASLPFLARWRADRLEQSLSLAVSPALVCSAYLVAIQIKQSRPFCAWCGLIALINLLIFLIGFV